MQGRSGDTDVENRPVDIVGDHESRMNVERSIGIYALSRVK